MKKKKYNHFCEISNPIYGKKRSTAKRVSPRHKSINNKALSEIFNKYYKDQVTALYRVINS